MDENQRAELDFFRDLHFKQLQSLGDRTQEIGLFVVKTLCSFNAAAVVAILSFMSLKLADSKLPMDVVSVEYFGTAFLLSIFAAMLGYLTTLTTTLFMATGKINTETLSIEYNKDMISKLKVVKIYRLRAHPCSDFVYRGLCLRGN